jgi:hypothetical protein
MKILDYIESKFPGHQWFYYLSETSIGYADKSLTRKTKILPVEYINSKFIAFVLENKSLTEDKPRFFIFTKDNFSKDNLEMYINAAREFTSEMTNKYHMVFSDYNKINHESDVQNVLMGMPSNLDISVTIDTFNNFGVRGMYNE